MNEQAAQPYKLLGTRLKYQRQHLQLSLAEVAGAVEIDQPILERIERGMERPAEDVLLLLISYFNMRELEAAQIWELAGYESEPPEKVRPSQDTTLQGKKVVMLLATDMRTIYTDGIEISADNAGLTMQFTQASAQQPMPIAKLGMSYAQANQVLIALQRTLIQAAYFQQPKVIPPQIDSRHNK